jgi:hypothetical protein
MKLGRDVVIMISADCVHYGDRKWGQRNYAPFGVDRPGYMKAVEQDLDVVRTTLSGEITAGKISKFRERVELDALDWPYKITWCGVYSIPFGLSVMTEICELSGRPYPRGYFLGYGTSIEPGPMPLSSTGLGVTNINTLRHWVGYVAVGYW